MLEGQRQERLYNSPSRQTQNVGQENQLQVNNGQSQVKGCLGLEQHKQMTYKIKDGLYIGTSVEAFKNQQFVLLNWVQHVLVLERDQDLFADQLKSLYGQQNHLIQCQGQQVIRYLHCDTHIFDQDLLCTQRDQHNTTNQRYSLNQTNQYNTTNEYEIYEPQHQTEDVKATQGQKHSQSIIEQIQTERQPDKEVCTFQQIFQFIEKADRQGFSCLIITSSTRPNMPDLGYLFSLCSCYLIRKYKWSLFKTLQYMNSRVQGVSINKKAYQYLNTLQVVMLKQNNLTYDWQSYQTSEQLIVRNTFLNSKNINLIDSLNTKQMAQKYTSRQKVRTKKKFQVPSKRIKTETNFQQKNVKQDQLQTKFKSILKDKNCKGQVQKVLICKNRRIEIKQSLNQVKQIQIQSFNKQFQIQETQNDQSQQTINKQLQGMPYRQKQVSFLTTSRIKQISLSVSKIVSKYKQQQKSQSKSLSRTNKSLYFDDFYQMNLKRIVRKKNNLNLQIQPNQAQIKAKNLFGVQIMNIMKRIKNNRNQDQDQSQPKNITRHQKQQSQSILMGKQKEKITDNKLCKGQSQTKITKCSNKQYFFRQKCKRQDQENITRQIAINRLPKCNWLDNLIKKNKSLSNLKQKNDNTQKKCVNNQKAQINYSFSNRKIDSGKQKQNNRLYIKQAKHKSHLNSKRQSKQNNYLFQNGRQTNFKMQFQDFREIVRNKQILTGTLISNKSKDQLISENHKSSNLSSVIDKLKKQLTQLDTNNSENKKSMLGKKQIQNHRKNTNTSRTLTKWR